MRSYPSEVLEVTENSIWGQKSASELYITQFKWLFYHDFKTEIHLPMHFVFAHWPHFHTGFGHFSDDESKLCPLHHSMHLSGSAILLR